MENEIKRCPFRKDEDGEFSPCYGDGCMAYLEYDQPVFALHPGEESKEPPKHVTLCRRMMQPAFYSGSCAT